ncbi:MAG: hypothetical protein ACP5FH_07575 [Terracidiphilus sp.]
MGVSKWVQSNVDYGRRLVDSGIEGARSGQEAFLDGKPITPYLGESMRSALLPAALGACVGALVASPVARRKSAAVRLTYGLLGGVLGMTLGLAWENRDLGASVAGSAWKNMGRVRDERWLSKHPIDYA